MEYVRVEQCGEKASFLIHPAGSRKLDTAREKLTLNLSKEGAKSALMVAEGHVAYLPDVNLGRRLVLSCFICCILSKDGTRTYIVRYY